MSKLVKSIHVRAISASSPRGRLMIGHIAIPCALGRTGRSVLKREGDGATPVGAFAPGILFWRPDRRMAPQGPMKKRPLSRNMGWCDAASDRNYNRLVALPHPASHEELWRPDHLYDVVMTLSHNTRPRIRWRGSAVFFHLATDDLQPTAGCVAVRARDAAKVLARLGRSTRLVIPA